MSDSDTRLKHALTPDLEASVPQTETRRRSALCNALLKLQALQAAQNRPVKQPADRGDRILFSVSPISPNSDAAAAESGDESRNQFLLSPYPKPQIERRGVPRRISRCTVSVCTTQQTSDCSAFRQSWRLHSSRIKGHLADISRSGLAMTLGRGLQLDEEVCLRIANPVFDHSLTVEGRIVRQQQQSEDSWLIMCQFDRALDFEQIEYFGRHLFSTHVV